MKAGYIAAAIIGVTAALGSTAYAQSAQPIQEVKGEVLSISTYIPRSDIGFSSAGYNAYIHGVNSEIKFSMDEWDPKIKVGDTIEAKVQPKIFSKDFIGLEARKN